jgi:phosphoribosylformylglycinamidine synthase
MCEIDPYRGTLTTAEEAIRNLVATGARPHAITDCLNFGNPEKPDRLGDFVRSCEALGEVAKKFSLPVVSGNVSLYNETEQGNVPPTPTVMMTGIVDDIDRIITSDFKEEGNIIYLVGDTLDEMGGSAYYRVMGGSSNRVPDLDLNISSKTVDALLEANSSDLLMAVHDVSEGGIAVSLSEMCIGGGFGADVNIKRVGSIDGKDEINQLKSDVKLFSESNSRYLVEVTLPLAGKFEDCLSRHEVPYTKIGTVGNGSMKISNGDDVVIDIGVDEIDRIWREALDRAMGGS